MSGYQDSASDLIALTPANPPAASALTTRYRACYTSADGDYKIVTGAGTVVTIPLFKGMNPVEIRGVYSSPSPPGDVWGIP